MIRQVKLEDEDNIYDFILEFIEEGWKEYPFKIDETLRDTIKNITNNGVAFVSENDGVLDGLIAGMICNSSYCRNQLLAQEIIWYVRKDKRQGISTIGAKLLKLFEKESIKRGASLIILSHIANLNAKYMTKMFSKNRYTLLEAHYFKEVM